MRIDEIKGQGLDISLNDVLKSAQFIKLLRRLKVRSLTDLNSTRIKNRIIQAWKQGKKNKVDFNALLAEIDTNVDTLLQEQD